MADYLLVVDMQSDYVAVGKAYHEELTAAVNDKNCYLSQRPSYLYSQSFFLGEKR